MFERPQNTHDVFFSHLAFRLFVVVGVDCTNLSCLREEDQMLQTDQGPIEGHKNATR